MFFEGTTMTVKTVFFVVCLASILGPVNNLSASHREQSKGLRFASYATSRHVEQLATDQTVRDQAWQTIQRMNITKLYVEVYRGGHVVSPEHLIFARDWLRSKDIDVSGFYKTIRLT